MPPMTGQPVSPSPFSVLGTQNSGASDVQQQSGEVLTQLRDLAMQVNDVVQANPTLAQEGQQITSLIKQMIVKTAKVAPAQTASAAEVPPGL